MNIKSLKMFVVLTQHLNFTEAAKYLDISQPTLSRKIKQLESDLNITLVHRVGSKVSLTPQGESFLESTNKILSLVKYSIEKLQMDHQSIDGKLRIGTLHTMGQFLVKEFLPHFHSKYPDIQIHWKTLCIDNLKVREHIDLIISPKEPNEDLVVSRKLSKYERECYASPAYLKKNGMPRLITDLEHHQCITQVNNIGMEKFWLLENKQGVTKKINVRGNMTTDSVDIATSLAKEGFGIALLPKNHVKEYVNNGNLTAIFPNQWFEVNRLYIFYKQNLYTPKRFKIFIEEFESFRKKYNQM